LSVLLTNPVPFFALRLAQLKQVSFYKKILLVGQMQAVKFMVGAQIKPKEQLQTLVVVFIRPEE
jgi:hypothetical protein